MSGQQPLINSYSTMNMIRMQTKDGINTLLFLHLYKIMISFIMLHNRKPSEQHLPVTVL